MLKSLYIKGLAVVDELQLEFAPGMTVLTGETGAGKSILLTAMGLCLGDRADSSYIRPGIQRAEISLEFSVHDAPAAADWLTEQDLDDEQSCIIRRTIHADGRSRAFINGQPTTLQRLQELAEHLINIHGQHDHLLLLRADAQRQLLDESLSDSSVLIVCQQAYDQLNSLKLELSELTGGGDQTQQKEFLRYQISELEQAQVNELNYDELVAEHTQLANMEQILTTGQAQLDRLYEHDTESLYGLLGSAVHELDQLSTLSSDFEPITTQLQDLLIQLQDACRELRRTLELKELDPSQLNVLDQQLDRIHALSRKLHVAPQDLPETLIQLQNELQRLEHQDERLNQLQSDIDQAKQQYVSAAQKLSDLRKSCAEQMSNQISQSLHTLGMPDGRFSIQVEYQTESHANRHGQDQIQFCVSTNPGLPLKPVSRVASGGELSRICLAIQVTASRHASAPTLIFDEVDSGIGGGVAETVGSRLREIGAHQQVFCVTHLPQVAAQGHQHLRVSKIRTADSTSSKVGLLHGTERTQEIARMLGGLDISQTTLAHAEEMLKTAAN